MIPKRQPVPVFEPTADERPEGLPPIQHSAIDIDVCFTNGAMLPLSIIDGNGSLEEFADRWSFVQDDERLTILKASVAYLRSRTRTFTTEPELFKPSYSTDQSGTR